MRIGIDIDGVLVDLERAMIDYGTKICVEKDWPIELDLTEYAETKIFNWTEEQSLYFWNTYFVEYVTESQPRAFASDIIQKLQQEGNEIYFITARNEYGMPQEYCGKMQSLTKKWLEKYDFKYKKLIFAPNNEKLQYCIKNSIDIMVEDSPSNIEYMSNKIKIIKFDCQYNKNVNNENIITAYSWYHIYEIIKKMQ